MGTIYQITEIIMKITYRNNDATQIPIHIVGTCIQIRQWLRGEQYVPYLKSVFAFNNISKEEDERLTLEKRMAEADDADRTELEEYYMGE